MSNIDIFIPDCILPPREAYRYWPSPDFIFKGKPKKCTRFIFENQILTDFEQEKLDRLLKEIEKGKLGKLKVPAEWSKNHLLRFKRKKKRIKYTKDYFHKK